MAIALPHVSALPRIFTVRLHNPPMLGRFWRGRLRRTDGPHDAAGKRHEQTTTRRRPWDVLRRGWECAVVRTHDDARAAFPANEDPIRLPPVARWCCHISPLLSTRARGAPVLALSIGV